MSSPDHQPPKPSVTPGGTSEKRQSIKKTVDTGPVFAAALERLNRRSMIALIEEVMEQISEHCEKIGISLNNYTEIKNAYAILDQHLQDLRVTNDICITEINNIKQEIISLHAHIPCISVIEKIEELNIKINDMSEKHSSSSQGGHPPPQSKTAWCSSCLCAAAFILAAAALAWLLHTQYHQNAQQQTLLYQQITDRLTAFESRLKQLEERQTNQTALAAVLQQKIDVNAQAIANLDQCRPMPGPVNPSDEPLPPSTVTLVTLETNLNLLKALFQQKIASYEQSIINLKTLFQQQTVSYEQTIIKMEKCCAAPSPGPAEQKDTNGETPKEKEEDKKTTIVDLNKDINVLTGVNFATDSSTLNEDAKKILTQVAVTLKSAKFSGKRFEIAGHTDNIGDDKKNEILSQNRANAVRKFLIAQGIQQEFLTSKGYGESKPIAENTTPAGQAKNRRVELDKQDNQ